jgi:hypothetical protein
MVTAWLFAASLGILFARYFRLTWVGKQFMGKDLWFVVSYYYTIFLFSHVFRHIPPHPPLRGISDVI